MCDGVFDDDRDEKVLRIQELDRIQQSRKLEGYREGVIAGKELSLQDGFDDGFRDTVAAMTQLGKLKGVLSALVTYRGSCIGGQVLQPGDLCDIESLQREVAEFEERTRTSIKTTESRLPALPTDENMEESSRLFPPLDESTIGGEGSTATIGTTPLTEGKLSTSGCKDSGKGVVSDVKCATDKNTVGDYVAPLSDCQQGSSGGMSNEAYQHIAPTNNKAKYDFITVKTQMKQMNCDSIDITKLTILETQCHRIMEKFGLSSMCV